MKVRVSEHLPAVDFPGAWRSLSVRGPALFTHVSPSGAPIDGLALRTRDCAGRIGTLGYGMVTVAKVCSST